MKSLSECSDAEKIKIGRDAEALYMKVMKDTVGTVEDEQRDDWSDRFPCGVETNTDMHNSFFKIYCDKVSELNLPEDVHFLYIKLAQIIRDKFIKDPFFPGVKK